MAPKTPRSAVQDSLKRSSRRRAARLSKPPADLASRLRGLYSRVAHKLKVDPSYVSRVARGERSSRLVSNELRRQLNKITRSAIQ